MNAWTQQLAGIAKAAAQRDKYAGLTLQKKLAAEKLDLVERAISEGFTLAANIANETGISHASIHSYLRVLEKAGRIESTSGKRRMKTFSVVSS